jgi:hypothetical protein
MRIDEEDIRLKIVVAEKQRANAPTGPACVFSARRFFFSKLAIPDQ